MRFTQKMYISYCKNFFTPMNTNEKLCLDGTKKLNEYLYISLVDKLMYLTHNWWNILFFVNMI